MQIAGIEFSGDTTAADWEEVLGESRESYIEPVRGLYDAPTPPGDRNDIVRDEFNQRVGPEGNRDSEALARFYGHRDSTFSRLLAFECPCEGLMSNAIKAGIVTATHADGARKNFSEHLLGRFPDAPVRVLDHGCGNCHFGLGVLVTDDRVHLTFYDHLVPSREVLFRSLAKYAPSELTDRVWFCEIGNSFEDDGPYAGVISQEVLEHLEDPVGELERLSKCVLSGGVLYLSTFFDSCNGHDPSHLDEHKAFQDTKLLFGMIEECGFKLLDVDPNGVEKIWEKV